MTCNMQSLTAARRELLREGFWPSLFDRLGHTVWHHNNGEIAEIRLNKRNCEFEITYPKLLTVFVSDALVKI